MKKLFFAFFLLCVSCGIAQTLEVQYRLDFYNGSIRPFTFPSKLLVNNKGEKIYIVRYGIAPEDGVGVRSDGGGITLVEKGYYDYILYKKGDNLIILPLSS